MAKVKKLPFKKFKEIYTKVPRLSVEVIIRDEKGVVLSKRDIEPEKGKWHLPGGTILFGETIAETAVRVAKEETGLDIRVTDQLGVLEYKKIKGYFGHIISVVVVARPTGGELKKDKQSSEINYFYKVPENTIELHKSFLEETILKDFSPKKVFGEIERKYPEMPESDTEMEINDEIRWKGTAMGRYKGEEITPYYKKNKFARETRWDLWNDGVRVLKKNGITNLLDIGTGNGHFVYLCLKNGIDAWGVDPRVYKWVDPLFIKEFGEKRIYKGSLRAVEDYFLRAKPRLVFDCISILNFLHGNDHRQEEIVFLYHLLRAHAKYVFCSDPQWEALGMPSFLQAFEKVEEFDGPVKHYLYRIQ